tara:strand:- start:64 stop:501 length:438 start_codon:yes stop_codon:yes gene_type:complete
MTVKTETNFYKNVKKLLENGDEEFIVTRIESYATPGFPDCIIYHKDLGFFTIELKVVRRSNKGIGKVLISPLQTAWHLLHVIHGAPVYILVYDPGKRIVNLFEGDKLPKLRKLPFDDVVPEAMYTGPLPGMQLVKLLSPQTPKLH